MKEIHIYFAFTIYGIRERCSFGQITGQRGGTPKRPVEGPNVSGLKNSNQNQLTDFHTLGER